MVPIGGSKPLHTVPLTMAGDEVGPEAVRLADSPSPVWHLAQADRPLTLCGRSIQYGSRRRLWAETPADERCDLCLQRLGL
jgi:hypothetical protein